MFEDMLPNKLTHSKCYHCEGSQHISVQEHWEYWSMNIHVFKTSVTTMGMQAFYVNSVKLHNYLSALKPLNANSHSPHRTP